MKTKMLSIFLSVCIIFTLVPFACADGEISLDDGVIPEATKTYTIADAQQLIRLAYIVNSGNDCSGVTFVLTANIAINTGVISSTADGRPLYNGIAVSNSNPLINWDPIGNCEDKPFSGTFDGNGFYVSGIYINDTNKNFCGFFGCSYGGHICKLRIVNSYILGSDYVGGVCGYTNDGTVKSCSNMGTVISRRCAGGVCGLNTSNANITFCCNIGSVRGGQLAGGVCGSNDAIVTSCYNTGTVSGSRGVGGVCGSNEAIVTSCYNVGIVSGESSVGGVCGYNSNVASTNNCFCLESSCSSSGSGISITASEMKTNAFVLTLNEIETADNTGAFVGDACNANGGYPLLRTLHKHIDNGIWTVSADHKTETSPCACYNCGMVVRHHTHIPAVDTAVPATCTKTGLTEGCHCSVCGEVIVAQVVTQKLPHTYSNWAHIEGTKAHTRTCSCGEVQTQSCNFTTAITPATCNEDGYITYTCHNCGYTYTEKLPPAADHIYGEWVSDNNATFFKDGTKTRRCTLCGSTETVTDSGSAHWHRYPVLETMVSLFNSIFAFLR